MSELLQPLAEEPMIEHEQADGAASGERIPDSAFSELARQVLGVDERVAENMPIEGATEFAQGAGGTDVSGRALLAVPNDEARTFESIVGPREHILQFFAWAHLPPYLATVSQPFGDLASQIVDTLPRNPERTVALRKLLEAKDAAVRAAVAK